MLKANFAHIFLNYLHRIRSPATTSCRHQCLGLDAFAGCPAGNGRLAQAKWSLLGQTNVLLIVVGAKRGGCWAVHFEVEAVKRMGCCWAEANWLLSSAEVRSKHRIRHMAYCCLPNP